MNKQCNARRPATALRTLVIALVAVLVMSLVPAASGGGMSSAAMLTVPPQLLDLANARPDSRIALVIQARSSLDELTAQLQSLGGTVTHQLPMLNALAVELPTSSLPRLAASPAIARIALDTSLVGSASSLSVDTKKKSDEPQNTYLETLGIPAVWADGVTGKGIGVAVIDSGIANDSEFNSRLVARLSFSGGEPETPGDIYLTPVNDVTDRYGHGTHVAGIIGAEGKKAKGAYAGIAPDVNLISLRIMDENGQGRTSDAMAAIQWVLDHQEEYNIRVVNLSFNTNDGIDYRESALNAAIEMLWFKGIVVVASAGDNETEIASAPANDPFIITVAASDEMGNGDTGDDTVLDFGAPFTIAYTATFTTSENLLATETFTYAKPDIFAPGKDIISVLAPTSKWKQEYPNRVVLNNAYFRLSGTSMAAPMVTGAVALMLQKDEDLAPAEVKCRLLASAGEIVFDSNNPAFAYLDVEAAVDSTAGCGADNPPLPMNNALEDAVISSGVNWNSVNWNSVNWNSVNWNSVNWNSVNWNSVNWNSVNWNSVNWNSVNWNSVIWDD